ncbi:WG repeat-containing protein [Pseudobutyrivibrio sp.]|uniref:WG repeat-containing protein n=1 Tax=Pseudobutyrivibrio sp. TaxID=2014367 RepID=UPI00386782BB
MIKNTKSATALILTMTMICGILFSCGNESKGKTSFVKGDKQNAYYYIDTKGELLGENGFIKAKDFNEDGIAFVTAYIGKKDNYTEVVGYIDANCEFVGGKYWETKGSLSSYTDQSGCGVMLLANPKYGDILTIMDTSGKELAQVNNIDETYFPWPSDNGYIGVETTDGKCGYVDKNGKWIIEPKFSWVGPYTKGYAFAKENGKVGLIDEKGNWALEPQYYDINYGGDGTFFRANIDDNGNYVYVNKEGDLLNDKQYSGYAGEPFFEDGLCAIYDEESGLVGFMDESGEYVIEAQYKEAHNFHEGYAPVCEEVDGKDTWGYVDKSGEIVIDYQYQWAGPFSEEGYALVKVDGKYGYINKDGSWFLKPQFDDANSFSNGYAVVQLTDGQTIEK